MGGPFAFVVVSDLCGVVVSSLFLLATGNALMAVNEFYIILNFVIFGMVVLF